MLPTCWANIVDMSATNRNVCRLGDVANRHKYRHCQPSPPGLGALHYAEIGTALMEVLPRLLPTTTTDIQSSIAVVGFESNNGFDLLWRILELAVLGFDLTVLILPQVWHRDSNVLESHQSYLLYFWLQ